MKFAVVLWVALLCMYSFAKTLTGRVVAVYDGDTIKVLDESKIQHKVRLSKIDAPEKKQAYGEKSRQHLSALIFGKQVRVDYDKTDRYSRILGEVFCENVNINLQMVRDGYAWHYKFYDNSTKYVESQRAAKGKGLGLWNDKTPVEPHLWRKANRRR